MANDACITSQLQENLLNIFSSQQTKKIRSFAACVLDMLELHNTQVNVLFCTDSYIKQLNKTYRNIDCTTDILSFADSADYIQEGKKKKSLGDIAISIQSMKQNAKFFGEDENTELKRLLIHGILHLNGMDHGEEHIESGKKPKSKMLLLQEDMLNEFKDWTVI